MQQNSPILSARWAVLAVVGLVALAALAFAIPAATAHGGTAQETPAPGTPWGAAPDDASNATLGWWAPWMPGPMTQHAGPGYGYMAPGYGPMHAYDGYGSMHGYGPMHAYGGYGPMHAYGPGAGDGPGASVQPTVDAANATATDDRPVAPGSYGPRRGYRGC